MKQEEKLVLYKWLKSKSTNDWLECAPEDNWVEWLETSLRELETDGVKSLILFGPEVMFIVEKYKVTEPENIVTILIDFYKNELTEIKNLEEM